MEKVLQFINRLLRLSAYFREPGHTDRVEQMRDEKLRVVEVAF
jgi:hypothetical protein